MYHIRHIRLKIRRKHKLQGLQQMGITFYHLIKNKHGCRCLLVLVQLLKHAIEDSRFLCISVPPASVLNFLPHVCYLMDGCWSSGHQSQVQQKESGSTSASYIFLWKGDPLQRTSTYVYWTKTRYTTTPSQIQEKLTNQTCDTEMWIYCRGWAYFQLEKDGLSQQRKSAIYANEHTVRTSHTRGKTN